MHKSIIFLLGLLVFLIPVGPTMSNTKALAFNDYGYQADKYEKYANDMANDNYYKSQSSDIIKKIKCNNINSNFNGVEANIGTSDSFGLGAESIQGDASANAFGNDDERNNVYGNFDFDCINNNDNENAVRGDGDDGGTGPEGPRGPAGPAGPAGINQILSANLYPALGNVATANSSLGINVGTSTASCDEGDVVIEGGYYPIFSGSAAPVVGFDGPLPNPVTGDTGPADSAYSITLFSTQRQMNTVFQAYAYCFDNPPLNTLAAADAVSTFQHPEDAIIMSQGLVNSPAISQVTEDSPELTATEKITKLKTQWLDLLP